MFLSFSLRLCIEYFVKIHLAAKSAKAEVIKKISDIAVVRDRSATHKMNVQCPGLGGPAVGCSQWRACAAETCFLWPSARAPVWQNSERDVRPVCSVGRLKYRWIILSNRIWFTEVFFLFCCL